MLLNAYGERIIESDMKNGHLIPFLLGAPGIGKSSIVKSISKKNGWGFHELLCNQIAMQADLTGCRTMEYEWNGEKVFKQVFFPHAVVQEAIQEAVDNPDKIVVLFLDEVNRTNAAVTSALLTFITARTIGTEVLPVNIKLIAAGNDDGNVISLDSASITRFMLRRCQPDASVFLGLGKVHPIIEELLKTQPALIYQTKNVAVDEDDDSVYSAEESEFQQITVPRTIMGLNVALLDNGPMIMAMGDEELKEYIAGFTGDTLFTEAVATNIIANKYKLASPNKIEAPDKPVALDSLMGAAKITDMQTIAAGMSDEDRSASILYMVYDANTDYTNAVKEILNTYTKNMLLGDDMQKLTAIINNGNFNHDSYEAIINTQTALANAFKIIYGV